MAWVGFYYVASGTVALLLGTGLYGLSPGSMVGTFGVGQRLAAGGLYYALERHHEPTV